LNREGVPDPSAPQDTVEVHALFDNEAGFFGLTSYLSYADAQLKQSFATCDKATRQHGSQHKFPWRYVDQSQVAAVNFMAQHFQFTFDQEKILDLLTGHTLYNDADVVVRELVQNSLDAVRLQALATNSDAAESGRIDLFWDSGAKVLEVLDNGTGMTQEIIENHLLKVGSSRYQDQAFQEKYPDFAPISRFGIGVLSTFMLADIVEIVTVSPEEEEGRRLLLRDVHGRYLVRFVDKARDDDAIRIGEHGTLVRLTLRTSANIADAVEVARRWVVVPAAPVSIVVDGGTPQRVGFVSLKDALEDAVDRFRRAAGPESEYGGEAKIEVREESLEGTTVAYAVRWNQHFEEWEFVQFRRMKPLGICVEGIRVEADTPGFTGPQLLSIANATGPSAPKTNVARSGLELGLESSPLFHHVYRAYLNHIRCQIDSLVASGRSITFAADEAAYLMGPLHPREGRPAEEDRISLRWPAVFADELGRMPIILVEEAGERRLVSFEELAESPTYWTVASPFFSHASWMIREAPIKLSYGRLASAVGAENVPLPDGLIVVHELEHRWWAGGWRRRWEPARLMARKQLRQLDVEWRIREPDNAIWREFDMVPFQEVLALMEALSAGENADGLSESARWRIARGFRSFEPIVELYSSVGVSDWRSGMTARVRFASEALETDGLVGYDAVRIGRSLYFLPPSELGQAICDDADRAAGEGVADPVRNGTMVATVAGLIYASTVDMRRSLAQAVRNLAGHPRFGDTRGWAALAASTERSLAIFDPAMWRRGND
jgi:hypothetical protein